MFHFFHEHCVFGVGSMRDFAYIVACCYFVGPPEPRRCHLGWGLSSTAPRCPRADTIKAGVVMVSALHRVGPQLNEIRRSSLTFTNWSLIRGLMRAFSARGHGWTAGV